MFKRHPEKCVQRCGRHNDAERPLTAGLLCQAVLLLCLPLAAIAEEPSSVQLVDVTNESGISFRHTDGSSGRYYIVEYVSAGLVTFDYDGDGRIDIYFLNGGALPGTAYERPPENALYRNLGNWQFSDATRAAGLGDTGHGLGVATADYDEDGDQDLYVNNFGRNSFYCNQGDGTFLPVAQVSGVENGDRVGAGVCFLDADRDGMLDLYVANYVKFSYQRSVTRTRRGASVYPGPQDYEAEPDTLYVNQGDGRFADATQATGIGRVAGTGMGAVCCDYDQDGDTDIFVCNDVQANFLFQNDGAGRFEEVGLLAGTAFDFSGLQQGSMGVACGDYDNDGRIDFFQTSYENELPVLYRNVGNGFFDDFTVRARAAASLAPHVNWGAGFVDFDNDGDRDLFVANGHLMDTIHQQDDTKHYAATNALLMNRGDGTFVDITRNAGDGMQIQAVSRGAAFDDLDNDGDVDVIVLNARGAPSVLRNDSKNENHWLQLQLAGQEASRDGIGARVTVVAGDLRLVDEVHSGRGYQSDYGRRLYFGLGPRTAIDYVEVAWLGGSVQRYEAVPVDRLVKIRQADTGGH